MTKTNKRQAIPVIKDVIQAPLVPELIAEEKELDALKHVIAQFKNKLTRAEMIILAFSKDFAKNPSYALEWNLSTFAAVAQLDVFSQALLALTDSDGLPALKHDGQADSSLDALTKYAMDKSITMAGFSEHSSSQQKNIMDRECLAAWANVFEIIRWRR